MRAKNLELITPKYGKSSEILSEIFIGRRNGRGSLPITVKGVQDLLLEIFPDAVIDLILGSKYAVLLRSCTAGDPGHTPWCSVSSCA